MLDDEESLWTGRPTRVTMAAAPGVSRSRFACSVRRTIGYGIPETLQHGQFPTTVIFTGGGTFLPTGLRVLRSPVLSYGCNAER